MKLRDAVIQVLQEAGKPLYITEITQRILSKNLWSTKGKTPANTVAALLYTDIKRNGEQSPFVLVAPGTFGLRTIEKQPISEEAATVRQSNLNNRTVTYSFTNAAEKVLEQFGKGEPMHYRDITEKALEMGLLTTEGKTPEATMYAQIISEIKRYRARGEQPRFIQHGKGYISLSQWTELGLASQIEQHNKKVRQELRNRLLNMEWDEFEDLIARLLAEMGFEDIEVTTPTRDGGIDVRGTLVVGDVIRTRMAIQVKKWKHNIQTPIIQQVRGSLGTHEQGLIITTSDFSAGARKEAARPDAIPVALMNGEQLVILMVEYGIGVTRVSYDLIELGEDETITNDTV
ncbi:MAG TPA: HTH domain-containing protein [Bacillota bacterium]|nr:HTH domain-containing protein [Bacillota bacterium]